MLNDNILLQTIKQDFDKLEEHIESNFPCYEKKNEFIIPITDYEPYDIYEDVKSYSIPYDCSLFTKEAYLKLENKDIPLSYDKYEDRENFYYQDDEMCIEICSNSKYEDEEYIYCKNNLILYTNLTNDITLCVVVDRKTLPARFLSEDAFTPNDLVVKNSLTIGSINGNVGNGSFSNGYDVVAKGGGSHAEGYSTEAIGNGSHAEGYKTKAVGNYSHAEGYYAKANENYSHAEGYYSEAGGRYSHAEGYNTKANKDYSHTEGYFTEVKGYGSHAEGYRTIASGRCSHTEGYYTKASSDYQHAQGKHNIEDTEGKYAHIVGNGTGLSECSNAYTLDWNGNGWYKGRLSQDGTPANDKDLTTKKYVDDKFNSLPQLSFNEEGELVVTINGVTKIFVPKSE